MQYDISLAPPLPVPAYLEKVYWWAYVRPGAVRLFEREWLVNLILFNNYVRLRDAALTELGAKLAGTTLQIACVYGNLTERLRQRLTPGAKLDIVDVLPIQLQNLARKLAPDTRVRLLQGDSAALPCADAHYDQVLLFFLLHEQPAHVRQRTLAEAQRVVRPGGRIVIVDYHRPRPWSILRPLMALVFRCFEPFAPDLWHSKIETLFPAHERPTLIKKTTMFSDLYQVLVLRR